MTAPTSLYQMEMQRRGLALPKAQGCPRKPLTMVVTVPKVEKAPKAKKVADRTHWQEYADLYLAGLTLTEVARRYGVTFQAVQYALLKLNVPRRPRGDGHTHKRLLAELEEKRREIRMLRARLEGLRRKYKEAA